MMMMMTTKKTLKRYHSFSISSVSLKNGILIPVILILMQMTTDVVGRRPRLNVPKAKPAIVGLPVTLECDWDRENFEFNSIRWYKDDEEFYSFIKGNTPEKADHRLVGLEVDLDLSDDRNVTISNVTAAADAKYTCSVLSQPPLSTTVNSSETKLIVYKTPDKPEIIGLKPSYREGEILNITCIARHSNPRAYLRHFVNGEPVVAESGYVMDDGKSHYPRASSTTYEQIAVHLSPNDVGNLTVTCVANQFGNRWKVIKKTSSSTNVEPSGGANILPVSLLIGLMVYISLIIQSLC